MSKVFNAYERKTIKSTAGEVARLETRKVKLLQEMGLIEAKVKEVEDTITQYEDNIRKITGGFTSRQLCEKVSRGKQMDWVFKYPDTVVPPTNTTAVIEQTEQPEGGTEPENAGTSEVTESNPNAQESENTTESEFENNLTEIPAGNNDPLDAIFND